MADSRGSRWLAPRVALGLLALLIALQILLSPYASDVEISPALSSRSASPNGARGLYETLERLGFQVGRGTMPLEQTLDSTIVLALLTPRMPLTRIETHRLLDAVRGGAHLLVTPLDEPLSDSLGVRTSRYFPRAAYGPRGGGLTREEDDAASRRLEWVGIGEIDRTGADSGAADSAIADSTASDSTVTDEEVADFEEGLWPERTTPLDTIALAGDTSDLTRAARGLGTVRYHLAPLRASLDAATLESGDLPTPFPADTVSFVTALLPRNRLAPVVMGIRLGKGRIVAVADPYLLTNLEVRDGDAAVIAVRAIEWLAPDRQRRIVFDEYHLTPPEKTGAGPIARAVFQTPLGRVTAQLLFAAVLLLLALGARPLAPRPRMRLERRSPFEHVGALARAYEQVRATRLASRRLLHGLRRRHPIGRLASDDDSYLAALGSRYPHLRDEIARVRAALETPLPPEKFLLVGNAIETIERKIES